MTLTKTQRAVLNNAQATGCPWIQADGKCAPNSSTTGFRMMMERLEKAGYLYGGKITDAGRAALQ